MTLGSSVGARSALALWILGLLLVLASGGWRLHDEMLQRGRNQQAELRALPLLYAAPLARELQTRDEPAVQQLLELMRDRHGLLSVELSVEDGRSYRAEAEQRADAGPSSVFDLGPRLGASVRVQAAAVSWPNLLAQDRLLRIALQHLGLALLLGALAVWLVDRQLLRPLRRLSDRARSFDVSQPALFVAANEAQVLQPQELQQLEQALAHVHTRLGDELQREQSQVRTLRHEITRQSEALQRAERALESKRRELEALERHDGLTGLNNRRAFDEVLRREFKRAQRDGGRLALAVLDLDHLRAYNDLRGRAAGDDMLRRFGRQLGERFKRDTDFVARLGGEEFAVLLPGFDAVAAQALLDQLREDWRALVQEADPLHPVTVSIGLAAMQPSRPYLSPQGLLQAADEALYIAKHTGRDRLSMAA